METCDENNLYKKYYDKQQGGSLPFFAGLQYQRGHGLGGLLCIATCLVKPFIILKRGAKRLGK